jgi:hypothetical protein
MLLKIGTPQISATRVGAAEKGCSSGTKSPPDSLVRSDRQWDAEREAMSTGKRSSKPASTASRLGLAFLLLLAACQAATFNIADGDVAGLIAAIQAANTNGQANTINLAPTGTYILTAVAEDGASFYGCCGTTGLPYIRSQLTIHGNGATIQRSTVAGTPQFGILAVGGSGRLMMDEATLRNRRRTTLARRANPQKFRITHPFHPLAGREFELLWCKDYSVERRACYLDKKGRHCEIPLSWTDLAPEDPLTTLSTNRSWFRVSDLLELARLIEVLRHDV